MRSGQLGWPTGTCPEHSVCAGFDRDSINAVEINGASSGDE